MVEDTTSTLQDLLGVCSLNPKPSYLPGRSHLDICPHVGSHQLLADTCSVLSSKTQGKSDLMSVLVWLPPWCQVLTRSSGFAAAASAKYSSPGFQASERS